MNKVQQTLGAMALSIGIVANSTFAEETKATTAHTQTAVRIAMAKTGKYIHTGTSKADEGLRKLKEELEHLKVKGKEKAFERFIKQIEIFKSNKNYSKLVELLKDKDISVDVLDYIEEN
jgi:hypothetical protein